jgi:hypothetical protein
MKSFGDYTNNSVHDNDCADMFVDGHNLNLGLNNPYEVDMISNSTANLRTFKLRKQMIEENQHMVNKTMPRVLVICTGGTLTMVNTPSGYQAQPGFINRLKVYANLYDNEFSAT